MRGSQPKPNSFSRRRRVAVPRLQQAHDVLVEVGHQPVRLSVLDDVARERRALGAERAASADSRAADRRASGCRSIPGSTRGRAAPGCRRRAGRCCRAAAAESPPTRMICTPTECCVQPDGVADRRRSCPGPSTTCSDRRRRGTRPAECRTRARPSPACSARSAARAADRRSADACSVVVAARHRCRVSPSRLVSAMSSCRTPRRRLRRRPAGEQAVEIFGSREVLAHEHRRVRVRDDVLAEDAVVRRGRSGPARRERRCRSRRGSATQRSAIADVRVKRGSTWMTVRAALARLDRPSGSRPDALRPSTSPMIRIASALTRSCCAVVAPPRPNEVPRPGTVELCHIRA